MDGNQRPISPLHINAPPSSVDWFYSLTTTDSLFDHASDVARRAAKVDILYEVHYGYPRLMLVEWSAGQLGDEIGLHVMNSRLLP